MLPFQVLERVPMQRFPVWGSRETQLSQVLGRLEICQPLTNPKTIHGAGIYFADLMRGKNSASSATGKSAVSSMIKLSKGRKLPDWARAATEESPQVVDSVSDTNSNEDVDGNMPTLPEVEEGKGSTLEPSHDIGRPITVQLGEIEVESQRGSIDIEADHLDEEAERLTEPPLNNSAETRQEENVPKKDIESVIEEDGGILGMFDEESASQQPLPESVLNIQKTEKLTAWGMENSGPRRKQITTNKKASQQMSQDDFLRQPKAVLQQHCKKNGWAAPKYEKLSAKGRLYAYTVTVTRSTVGRGKNKIVGCPVLCKLPEEEDYFESISAISVAARVGVERCEVSPGTSGSLVGYQVRLDTAWNASTKLLFCTTGILLRRLGGDRDLDGVSHIVVDEVLERTVLGDFLLVNMKDLLDRRKASGSPLKLILMSATLDSELFSQYFGCCPVIKAKGRTFVVTTYYLEDIHDQLQHRLATDSSGAMHYDHKANKSKVIIRENYLMGAQKIATHLMGALIDLDH